MSNIWDQDNKNDGEFVKDPLTNSKVKFPIKYKPNIIVRQQIEEFCYNHPEHRPRGPIRYTVSEKRLECLLEEPLLSIEESCSEVDEVFLGGDIICGYLGSSPSCS